VSDPVQRWTTASIQSAENGGFVAYGDYLDKERENADLRATVTRLTIDRDSWMQTADRLDQTQARLRADAERLDLLQTLMEAYGFEDTHEGNRWMVEGPFMFVRDAIDAARTEPKERTNG